MSTVTAEVGRLVERRGAGTLGSTVADTLNMVRRNLIKSVRIPQIIVFSTIQPVMLLLLFTYVFGGIIHLPGGLKYLDFMVPAVIIQTVTFSSSTTGVGLATDLQSGMIDRFRSLPMARSAVLTGRTIADGVRMVFQVLLMVGVSSLLGFRFHAGLLPAIGLVLTAVLFGYAFSWISATIGLAVRDPETAQVAGFIWVFPFIFVSSAFAPVASLPGWMQPWARVNPVTSTADLMRSFSLGEGVVRQLGLGGPIFGLMWHTAAWLVGIIAAFSFLAVRNYRKAV